MTDYTKHAYNYIKKAYISHLIADGASSYIKNNQDEKRIEAAKKILSSAINEIIDSTNKINEMTKKISEKCDNIDGTPVKEFIELSVENSLLFFSDDKKTKELMKTIINGTEMVLMKRFTRELTALSESVIKEVEKEEVK